MRKILVSIVLLLSCLQAAQAEKVSRGQAEKTAAAFFRSARHAGISPASVPSLRIVRCSSSVPAGLPSEDAAFYVFNNTSGPGTPVKVLETALWDQSDPYNRLCPEVNGALSLTGCTATALAIVMRYHKWPERGTGILPGFTAEGTGAYTNDILVPLVENMGYSSSLQYVFKAHYEPEAWTDLMKSEIDGGRPILYGGYTTDWAGHSFVLDGYDSEGFFRVNWGWGGMSNGYFDIDILDPYEQGAGGADAGFSVGQDAVIMWGDGTEEDYSPDAEHSYGVEGTYKTSVMAAAIEEFTVRSLKGVSRISLSTID